VLQEEERQRALAVNMYVNSGMDLVTALDVLGVDVPNMDKLIIREITPGGRPGGDPGAEPGESEPAEDEPSEDKAIELARLRRYVRKGNHHRRAFTSDILTLNEINQFIKEVDMRKANVSPEADAYGDEIAAVIERALDGEISRLEFESEMRTLVRLRLTEAFVAGANIKQDDLTAAMQEAINEDIAIHFASIANMSQEIYAALDKR
jgi:hypothetical protein